jgi:predicted transcriptional regulator of viral defense system
MLNLTEKIIQNQLDKHIIRDQDLKYLLGGTDASRHALVNKALKKEELLQICRGFYVIGKKYRTFTLSQYAMANRIVPHSFISTESALSYHNFIPEQVTRVTSVAATGRYRQFSTPFGFFDYHVAPVDPSNFYMGVHFIQLNNQTVLMASPLRALIDYIYQHKIKRANLHFLIHSLRIDEENILKIPKETFDTLSSVYRTKYVCDFIKLLREEIHHAQ